MEQISITRALAEIKRLDDRITRMGEAEFISVAIGRGDQRRPAQVNMTIAELQSKLQSNRDSINDMFKRRAQIKAAIVQSNATTTVVLGGEQLTVAEAIERKKSIENQRQLVTHLKRQSLRANELVKNLNEKLDHTIETNLATIYGNDKGKVDPAMFTAISEPQRNQKEASLIDPNNISKWIEKLEDEISAVDTELDFLLSESNARTIITV